MTDYYPVTGVDAITREGDRVTQIVVLDAPSSNYPVIGVLNEAIHSWTLEGKFDRDVSEDSYDLVGPWPVK